MLNFVDEKNSTLGFSLGNGVGPKRFQSLLKLFGSAKLAWNGGAPEFKKAGIGGVNFAKFGSFRKEFVLNEYLQKLKNAKVEFIPFGDRLYAESLRKLPDPPIGLFVKGNKKLLLKQNSIGVVGARKITSYGRQVTENLVRELCSADFTIVSGMAMGVDGVAHKSAIENDGSTIAVLGCGVDCPYPKENERLYEEILDSNGLIISEYPLGMPASQGTFPARNRIIAALSQAILITEAAEDSGSLITAEWAIRLNKKVFAVPGPITSQMSRGAIKLLKQGAVLVSSAEDILDELSIKNLPAGGQGKKVNIKNTRSINSGQAYKILNISKEEEKIIKAIESERLTIDEISKMTKISARKLLVVISGLEMKGIVSQASGKFFLKDS